jgi:hypothetical protein
VLYICVTTRRRDWPTRYVLTWPEISGNRVPHPASLAFLSFRRRTRLQDSFDWRLPYVRLIVIRYEQDFPAEKNVSTIGLFGLFLHHQHFFRVNLIILDSLIFYLVITSFSLSAPFRLQSENVFKKWSGSQGIIFFCFANLV